MFFCVTDKNWDNPINVKKKLLTEVTVKVDIWGYAHILITKISCLEVPVYIRYWGKFFKNFLVLFV